MFRTRMSSVYASERHERGGATEKPVMRSRIANSASDGIV